MNSAPNHLLILTPGFPKDESDTTCIPYIQPLVRHIHQNFPEWEVSVISFQYPYRRGNYQWHNIEVFSAAGKNKRWLGKLTTWQIVWKKIQEIHSKKPISLIHSFWLGEAALLGKRANKRLQIPHLCTLMGQDVQKSNRFLKKRFYHDLPLIAISDFHANIFHQNTGDQTLATIPLGIIPDDFPSLNNERDIDILGVGGLIPLKNYQLFIRLINNILPDFPNLKAVIIGEGKERKIIEQMIEEWELSEHISLTGMLPRPEVLDYMNRSRIFLHPSTYESFGFVFSEALYSGMAISSFRVGAAKSGPKWKVADSADEMREQLVDLLPEKWPIQREKVPLFSDVAQAYVEQYQTLIAKKDSNHFGV